MNVRNVFRGFCVAVTAVLGLTVMAPSSMASPSDTAKLTAAGFDVETLKPGWSLVGDELWWDNGAVRQTIEPSAEAAGCPAGYVCFFSGPDLTGYGIAFATKGKFIFLPEYQMVGSTSWNDQMSSWINATGFDARWYFNVSTPNTIRCMDGSHGVSGKEHLPAADDNQASALYIYTRTTVCS
ncbi:peptidase inhibitor family I36 protein [Amycolatopsis sp. NPDC059657]|uniref:peptidase inhibitor family I36 protein n=1 Tax=Amycolatopsis sp. NPDC059657 TaxID=3346899 RepID=UPI00366CC67E